MKSLRFVRDTKAKLILLTTTAVLALVQLHAAPETFLLWPEGAPGETGDIGEEKDMTKPQDNLIAGKPLIRLGNVSKPSLAVYPAPPDKANGAAVMICPGGGYHILAIDLEGTEVAGWLNSIGVTAAVLKYRVPARKDRDRYTAPLEDAQRAMGLLRSQAAKWGVDAKRIGVMGFSAGAHLSVALAAQSSPGNAGSASGVPRTYPRVDLADDTSCRPEFVMLIYPGYLVEKNTTNVPPELNVTARTPPTLIIQTEDDSVPVEGALFYYLALKHNKVPAEMHLFATGGHGYGLRPTKQPVTGWPKLAAAWMEARGILSKE